MSGARERVGRESGREREKGEGVGRERSVSEFCERGRGASERGMSELGERDVWLVSKNAPKPFRTHTSSLLCNL